MRQPLAVLAGAVVAALGGLIVGAYPLTGTTPFIAGVLFGLVIAEVVVTVAGRQGRVLATVAAVLAAAGLAYAVWDDSGYGVRPIDVLAWIGVGLGALIAGLRAGWWRAVRG